jgi:hypothetical protein
MPKLEEMRIGVPFVYTRIDSLGNSHERVGMRLNEENWTVINNDDTLMWASPNQFFTDRTIIDWFDTQEVRAVEVPLARVDAHRCICDFTATILPYGCQCGGV